MQAVLESKQAVESNRIFSEIRKNLYAVRDPLCSASRSFSPRFLLLMSCLPRTQATYTGRSAQTGGMSNTGGRVPSSEKKSRKSGGKKGKTMVEDEAVPSGPAGDPDMTFLTSGGDEEKRQG